MKTRFAALAAALAVVVLGAVVPNPASAGGEPPSTSSASDDGALRLWYTKPVTDWESQALVQGNGSTGLMAFGDPQRERLHVNEKTLWRGGPAPGRNYAGGNRATSVTPEQLENYRMALDNKSTEVFGLPPAAANQQLTSLMFGDGRGMGEYQDFGDVYLDFGGAINGAETTGYERALDLKTAISTVSFTSGDVQYNREYFVSYPDQVAVIRLTASKAKALSFTTSATTASGMTMTTTADVANRTLRVAGQVDDNRLKAELQVRVDATGGAVTSTDGKSLTVTAADSVTLVYSTGTDYKNAYPDYRGADPKAKVSARIAAASAAGYDTLRANHLKDYRELFDRVKFKVGGTTPTIPTDELMAAYRNGAYDPAVDELAFQFGRYLSIAGSRQGDLPTNLCGLWMVGPAGKFWGADYHFNVNVQMNYWPAMTTNLAETQIPFNDYVRSLVVPGRLTADRSAAVKTENFASTPIGSGNGFLLNTQVNPFGHTAPIGSQEYGWNVGGSSWALQNVYDYYLFTGDEQFLRDTAYPMLKEMATFWNTYLWYSPSQQRLTVAPGVSAEQGPTAVGTAYDQSIVWELYRMTIDASERLGVDENLRATWKAKQSQLRPIILGEQGQVKEWFEETSLGKAQAGQLPEQSIWNFGAGGSANQGSVHRHTSQLIGLFPGTLINSTTPDWMKAAIVSLKQRSLNGTGWSKAMKINMYARTGLADDTYSMVRAMLAGNRNGLMDNLLDSHPPFQIDGNFGLTAGMTEMLLQSQLGYAQLLPAVPAAWKDGSVDGIVARGNFVIGMDWTNSRATEVRVTARNGGTFTSEYPGIENASVFTAAGTRVPLSSSAPGRLSFQTTVGQSYRIVWSDPSSAFTMDKVTNEVSALPTVAGTGHVGARVAIAVDGKQAASVVVDADGRWSLTMTAPLRPGKHDVTATQTAQDGIVSEALTQRITVRAPAITLDRASAKPGDTIKISLRGFVPLTPISVELHSVPLALGTVTSDRDGAAAMVARIPGSASVGKHDVIATGALQLTARTPLALSGSGGSDGRDPAASGTPVPESESLAQTGGAFPIAALVVGVFSLFVGLVAVRGARSRIRGRTR